MSPTKPDRLLLLGAKDLIPSLEEEGFRVFSFCNSRDLLKEARSTEARACIVEPTSLQQDKRNVRSFISRLGSAVPFTDVLAWAPGASAQQVRDLLTQGIKDVAIDGDTQTFVQRLKEVIDQQTYLPRMLKHRSQVLEKWKFEGILSRSPKMRDIFEVCMRTASTDASVLVFGETGTGKELLARAFHRRSDRSKRLVAINCAAVPENLIDSELFGHVKGAFTGATSEKVGLFRYADGGTLFLDEIGHIPLNVQHRLLRVLQEGCVRPVGGDQELPVDVRVIAATSVRLDEAVEEGSFREDLLYRLDVIRIVLPPLRERREDILFLFGHFAKKLSKHYNMARPSLHGSFLDAMQSYDWPGNVRQLENLTERLLLTHSGQEKLGAEHFQSLVAPVAESEPLAGVKTGCTPADEEAEAEGAPEAKTPSGRGIDLSIPLSQALEKAAGEIERAYLNEALEQKRGRVAEAAAMLGISRRTMQRKMKEHGLDKADFRQVHMRT